MTLLFMACSPRHAPVRDLLNFEKEEESIFQAVEKFQVDLTVEDSGSVAGLQEATITVAGYDIVHISGHAGMDYELGPVFYMENEVGDTDKVTPARLWEALRDFPPQVLFLSGCETGKSDKVNALESFAWNMVEAGIPLVLGWGLPVSDTGASRLAAELYHQLGMGKPVSEAVQRARQAMADQYHPWPLLRVFADGTPDRPLIQPGQRLRRRTHRGTVHKHLQGSQVAVLQQGFVGRRHEIQTGMQVLKGADETCGLLIHGPAGVGKSCLAGKLLERFPDKDLIVVHGELKGSVLVPQLRPLFDRKGHAEGMEILKANAEFPDKLKALLRSVFPDLPVILLFDDFEQNLVRKGNEHWLKPDARDIMIALLTALEWAEGQANLILTSRYPFVLEHEGRNLPDEALCDIPLMSLREADLKKKQAELTHIAKSAHSNLYAEIGGGNPRLLEWLDKIAASEADYDLEALREKLRDTQEEFRLTYLADVLAQTKGEAFHQFLRRAAVFRQPVPAEAFLGIALLGINPQAKSPSGLKPADEGNAQKQGASASLNLETGTLVPGQPGTLNGLLQTGVNLTLFEREDRRGHAPLFWVMPVIRTSQWAEVAQVEQLALHEHAYQWYANVIAESEETNPIALEEAVFHALSAGNVRAACVHAIDLGLYLRDMLLYREAVEVQQQVAEQINDTIIVEAIEKKDENVAILLNNLGSRLSTLQDNRTAIIYYEQALVIDRQVFGDAHPDVAIDLNNLGEAWRALGEPRKAIEYYEQALAITRKAYGEQHLHVANFLNNLGLAWGTLGEPRKAIEYYEQALAITREAYGEQHPHVANFLNNLGLAWGTLGEPRKAIEYYEQALAIDRQVVGDAHPDVAIRLNNLGSAWYNLGELLKAIEYYEQALAIDRQVFGDAHPRVAICLNNLGMVWKALGEKQKARAFYKQSLAIKLQFYEPDHPSVRTTQRNLELLLESDKD